MPRIPILERNQLTPEQTRVYDAISSGPRGVIGPLAAAIHRPDLCEKWSELGLVLRFNSSLSDRMREFVTLLTGRFWDSQFEWYAHEGFALKAGVPAESIERLRAGTGQFDDPEEQLLYDYCNTLLEKHEVDEATYKRMHDKLGTAGIVELTALVGYYSMIALTLNAHDFAVPDDVKPPLPKLPRRAG